jgi:hypothetical protein
MQTTERRMSFKKVQETMGRKLRVFGVEAKKFLGFDFVATQPFSAARMDYLSRSILTSDPRASPTG